MKKMAHVTVASLLATALSFPAPLLAQATPVSAVKAVKGPIEQVYQGLAQVRPLLETNASAQYDGRIVEVMARVGQHVTVGQPLARLNSKSVELGTSSLVLGGAGYTVVANIAGVVVAQTHTIGDVTTAGTPIFTIVPEGGFRVRLSVPLKYARDINYDSPATLHLSDGDVMATPSSVQPFDLTGSGFFAVEFALTTGTLPFGDVLTADIVTRRNDQALLVPTEALVEKAGNLYVFVVQNGKAAETQVKTGIRTATMTEIVSGLNVGDQVVTVGNYALEDGVEIKVLTSG